MHSAFLRCSLARCNAAGLSSPAPDFPQLNACLVQGLDSWQSFAGEGGQHARIAQLPPPLQSMPVRPFMLDQALNHLPVPSISHRVAKKEEQKGAFAKLFSWGSQK